jgi:hypothetical protein
MINEDDPSISLKVSFENIPPSIYILIFCTNILLITYLIIRVLELFVTRCYWIYCYYTNPNGDLDFLYTNV